MRRQASHSQLVATEIVRSASLEGEVARLQRGQQPLAVDEVAGIEAEDGIPLELREPQRADELVGDDAKQVGEDVVRVLQLDSAEVAAVAADVGEDQAAVGDLRHRADCNDNGVHCGRQDAEARMAARRPPSQ